MTQCSTYIAKPYVGPDGRKGLVGKCVDGGDNETGLALIEVKSNRLAGISYIPDAVDGSAACFTTCCLEFPCPTLVTLTAQNTVFSGGNTWFFEAWIVDGGMPVTGSTTIEVNVSGCHEAFALYTTPACPTDLCDLLPDTLTCTLTEFIGINFGPNPSAASDGPWGLKLLVGQSVLCGLGAPGGFCRTYTGQRDLCDFAACESLNQFTPSDCQSDLCTGCPVYRVEQEVGSGCFPSAATVCGDNALDWWSGSDVTIPECNTCGVNPCNCLGRRTVRNHVLAMNGTVLFDSLIQVGSVLRFSLTGGISFWKQRSFKNVIPATWQTPCGDVAPKDCGCSEGLSYSAAGITLVDVGGAQGCQILTKPINNTFDTCALQVQAILEAFPLTIQRYEISGGVLQWAYTCKIDL